MSDPKSRRGAPQSPRRPQSSRPAGESTENASGNIGSSSNTLLEERRELIEPGDHERYSHYVRKEKIVESAVMGTPVIALCGKVWVPGRVGFLGFKSLIRLLDNDVFLGRPMLPQTQPDYAGMPMMCSTGKTMAIGGIMDGCNIAIVVWGAIGPYRTMCCVLCFFLPARS